MNGGPTGHGLADWTCNRRASGALRVLWAQAFSQGPLGPTNPPHSSPDVAAAAEGVLRAGGGLSVSIKPRILGSNTMTRLLEAVPLPALLFEPTSGRVGLDRVQYARPNGSVRVESTYPPP